MPEDSCQQPGDADELLFSTGDLLIGVATAATQIEGGDRNNSWYDWACQPGNIVDGSSPVRATDHWRRWREDTDLMASLGLRLYRMGLEWSRIEPRPGEFDRTALDRYREEVAAVRAAGIEPLVTLHHFSHPSWLAGLGGFASPYAVDRFLSFTRVVVEELGDLVTEWVTLNEPNALAVQAYLFGDAPPGRTDDWGSVRWSLHHMARAHCHGYRLIHDLQPDAKVGFAHHVRGFTPMVARNPAHRVAARVVRSLFQDQLADAMLGGRFSRFLRGPGDVEPGRYYDYLGINYYTRSAVRGPADGTLPGVPVSDLGWEIRPEGLVELAADLHRRYPGPIWITENGTADARDAFRSRFLHEHLRAISGSSLPIERYYHWCFVDNWEWAQGETARFGIVDLDFETQERTVRESGRFLARVIADGGVTRESHDRWVAGQTYPVADG